MAENGAPPVRVVFLGSAEFAVPTLRALIAGPYRPVLVVTQPDRPAGRGRALRPPPVKGVAMEAGIPVLQPERLRTPEATAAVADCRADLHIGCAYGQILRPEILALPRFGTLNVHASLLPRWRGAAPVAAAIRAGDGETGVTIMLVDEGVDTGAILTARREPIADEDDAGSLGVRLAEGVAALLIETIPQWLAGAITPQPQDNRLATVAPRLQKENGVIDWSRPAVEIWRQVRACSPWPGATATLNGHALQIWQAHPASGEGAAQPGTPPPGTPPPGTIVAVTESIAVQTGAGILELQRVQREGRRALPAAEFARGERQLLHHHFT